MFEREYRDLRFVNRWQIVRRLKDQNLAEHQYFVTLYARQIAHFIKWGGNIGAMMTAALVHDIDETISGDMPGPYKRLFSDGELRDVNDSVAVELRERGLWTAVMDAEIRVILKVADLIDEAGWLYDEINLGNASLSAVLSNTMDRLSAAIDALDIIEGVDKHVTYNLHNMIVEQLCRKSSTTIRG
jgi:5'-deoxynucleotidase YfbR-like HD superfamily hydrolase